MAIVPMRRVEVLLPASRTADFTDWLYARSLLHLDSLNPVEELPPSYQSLSDQTAPLEEKVARLVEALDFYRGFSPGGAGFLEGVLSARPAARAEELAAAAARVDVEALHTMAKEARRAREELQLILSQMEKERRALAPFAGEETPLGKAAALRRVRVAPWRIPREARERFTREVPPALAWEPLGEELVWVAFPAGDPAAEPFLASVGAIPAEAPPLAVPVDQQLAHLRAGIAGVGEELHHLTLRCREEAARLTDAEMALGWYEAELARARETALLASSSRVTVARGYLPATAEKEFSLQVGQRFAGVVRGHDPAPGEEVPVQLENRRFFRPAGLLVSVFGLPRYDSLDPTPFISFLFLLFMGLCFGDVLYGLMLVALAAALRSKFRRNASLVRFFDLLMQAGVSAAVFGALTGSWAADLPDYLGEGNPLARLRDAVPHINPLDHIIPGLLAVVGVGVATQYLGLGLHIRKCWKRGDRQGALFDGGLWFVYLTGLLLMAPAAFAAIPPLLFKTGLALFLAGAVGLVLTQGRDQESWGGRLVVGGVSLYGILGSYGATGFLGDSLSYARILVLGLTTGLVGMSFNVLAKIAGGVPWAGPVLFVGLIIFGHVFNFFMSIIGSFVHPMRLVLLEFFGRFYESGGVAYRPFGVRSQRVELIDGGK